MNNKKKLLGVMLSAVVAIVAVGAIFWYQNDEWNMKGQNGPLYVGITDATADINNVNEVSMEVEKVEIYSASEGWVTVSSNSKSYNLLTLKAQGKTELYAREEVKVGAYNMVRVTLGDTTVETKSNGDVDAYMPAKTVTMNMAVNVNRDTDTHVTLDFLADRSLHTTADGKYVFAPVVEARSQSSTEVVVGDEEAVEMSGGEVDSVVVVGVDLDGTSKMDFNLNSGTDLRVDDSVSGKVQFVLGGRTYTADDGDEDGNNPNENEGENDESEVRASSTIDINL